MSESSRKDEGRRLGIWNLYPEGDAVRAERVGEPRCDFCLTRPVRWTYPAAPMEVVGAPVITDSDDDFAACDACHELIEAKRIGPMVERMVHIQRENLPAGSTAGTTRQGDELVVRWPPVPIHRRKARRNLLRFFDARTGPARPWPDEAGPDAA